MELKESDILGKIDRTGETFRNKYGTEFIIVEYNSTTDVIVEFQDEFKVRKHTNYNACRKGQVSNPYDRSIGGIGYIGLLKDGSKPKSTTREYKVWSAMMQRCYVCVDVNPSYKDCIVCERWHCYSNFLEDLPLVDGYEYWLNNPKQKISFDKDIKVKGNKVYSLETCCFVSIGENTKETFTRHEYTIKNVPIIAKNLETNEILEFVSVREAERNLGIASSNISCCLKGKQKTAKGYVFFYKES